MHEDQIESYSCPICGAGIGNDVDGCVEHDCQDAEEYAKTMNTKEAEKLARMKPSERIERAMGQTADLHSPLNMERKIIAELQTLRIIVAAELDRMQSELNELKKKV
jgi:hypothetical protein